MHLLLNLQSPPTGNRVLSCIEHAKLARTERKDSTKIQPMYSFNGYEKRALELLNDN